MKKKLYLFTIITLSAVSYSFAGKVVLGFLDSALVNSKKICLNDIVRTLNAPDGIKDKLLSEEIGEAAPAGHSRFINTGDIVSYNLESRFPDIAFVFGTPKRIRVRTDFVEHSVKEYVELIKDYFYSNIDWNRNDAAIEILSADKKWKSVNLPFNVEVSGLKSRFPKGNITVYLVILQDGKKRKIPVKCRALISAGIIVAAEDITRGTELSMNKCDIVKMDITNLRVVPLTDSRKLYGKRAKATIPKGTVISSRILERIPAIVKGEQVYIKSGRGRISISILGVARESGSIGEMIWVENSQNGKLLRGAVEGKGVVALN